jgi:hypothetical protein
MTSQQTTIPAFAGTALPAVDSGTSAAAYFAFLMP